MAIKKAIITALLLCLIAFGINFVLTYTGVTFRATGLELSQENLNINASWDESACDAYVVTVYKDDTKIEETITKEANFTVGNVETGKTYFVQVEAVDKDREAVSDEDSATIVTKEVQPLTVTSDTGRAFTSKTFKLSAEAEGNISYESNNKKVATVNENGKVKLKKEGTAEITVTAEETDDYCATTATVTVNSDASYEGEYPEMDNAIAAQAKKLAWPYGTAKSVYKYPSGNPTSYFKEAIDDVYPRHMHWMKQCRWGASCDVFVGTCVRASGYDTNFPRGLDEDYSYLPHSSKFEKVSASEIQSGDIMLRRGHIQIYIEDDEGTGYIANAHFKLKTYGIIEKKNPSLGRYTIYHPTGECTAAVSRGDTGENAERVQEFLYWAGFYDGKIDGKYGASTEKAVKAFQKNQGTETTGNFGETCLNNAKKYKVNTIEINQ
ncbi:MAG: peptidoglycan-binding protein [Bacillota bacterium]|nr:peptidoglycan-binding protein [Bacillota bacterium]